MKNIWKQNGSSLTIQHYNKYIVPDSHKFYRLYNLEWQTNDDKDGSS